MDVAATLTSRLIGTLFVERGLVSESQIRVALEIQRETGEQLGKILVDRFGVSRKELASVVSEQWAELGQSGSPEADARSNDSWKRLGEIFVQRGFVTPEQLDEALQRQRETGERVGEALVAQGAISKFELAGALAEQMSALEADAAAADAATVVPLTPRVAEPERDTASDSVEAQVDTSPGPVVSDAEAGEVTTVHEPVEETPATEDVEIPARLSAVPTPLAIALPLSDPTFGCVAFASTVTGYRLAHLGGPVPDVGSTVDVPDVGELVVLRLGPSPLPGDQRTCVFLEQPHRVPSETAVV